MRYSENFQGLFSCQTQEKTINAHIQSIYKKLGMHSREEIQKLLEIAGKAK